MRLFHVLPILSFFFGARASSLDSRQRDAHPLDTRDVLDVCASVDAGLVVPDVLGILTAVGNIGQLNASHSQTNSRNVNFDRYPPLFVDAPPFPGD